MKRLHPTTLEILAELVCADGSDQYRSAAEIARFLQRADSCFPDHDGQTSRRKWVLQQLHECNDVDEEDVNPIDRMSLEAVVLQLVDPREYRGEPGAVRDILARLNRVLATEGFMVTLEGATPRLQGVRGYITPEDNPGTQYLVPDFQLLTSDPIVLASLRGRWDEARRCLTAQAHLATVLLLGSILEGVLLVVIRASPGAANRSTKSPKDGAGKPRPFREWSLNDCIEVACERGWMRHDRLRFSHALRESRNLIHPMLQRKVGEWPNEHSCRICWEVVNAAIADLLRHAAGATSTSAQE